MLKCWEMVFPECEHEGVLEREGLLFSFLFLQNAAFFIQNTNRNAHSIIPQQFPSLAKEANGPRSVSCEMALWGMPFAAI